MYRVCTAYRISPRPGRACERAHKCASTDHRYALMQTPALLRMPQKRATRREVLQTPKLYLFLPLPPRPLAWQTLVTLCLFLFLSSTLLSYSVPRLHPSSPHHLFDNASYFFPLTYCILISFFFLLSPSGCSLLILAVPNGYVLRDNFPATAAPSFTLLRQSCFVPAEVPHRHGYLSATSMHQPHVNFIVIVRVVKPTRTDLQLPRLATALVPSLKLHQRRYTEASILYLPRPL